jgi:hypothetical protein
MVSETASEVGRACKGVHQHGTIIVVVVVRVTSHRVSGHRSLVTGGSRCGGGTGTVVPSMWHHRHRRRRRRVCGVASLLLPCRCTCRVDVVLVTLSGWGCSGKVTGTVVLSSSCRCARCAATSSSSSRRVVGGGAVVAQTRWCCQLEVMIDAAGSKGERG